MPKHGNARVKSLLDLHVIPKDSQVIYHYCSQNAFWSIIEAKQFWLSDIFTLNDALEHQWGRLILCTSCWKILLSLTKNFGKLLLVLSLVLRNRSVLLLVHSRGNGDLLSQWRAYSEDGKGFALGLRASDIYKTWGVRLSKIEYRFPRQRSLTLQSLIELQEAWRHVPRELDSHKMAWLQILTEFATNLSSLKNPAFFEEKEYRIVRALCYQNNEFIDVGAGSRGVPVPVNTRTRGTEKIAYVQLPLDPTNKGSIIGSVVIGPKNAEEVGAVKSRIENAGFQNFVVKKSMVFYR